MSLAVWSRIVQHERLSWVNVKEWYCKRTEKLVNVPLISDTIPMSINHIKDRKLYLAIVNYAASHHNARVAPTVVIRKTFIRHTVYFVPPHANPTIARVHLKARLISEQNVNLNYTCSSLFFFTILI